MGKYIVRRVLLALPVLIGVTLLVFTMMHFAPGDPVIVMLGPEFDQTTYDQLRQDLGLDQPLPVQYLIWLGRVVRGDLGKDFISKQPVAERMLLALPTTLVLAVGTTVVATLIGIPLGVIAAYRRDGIFDSVSRVLAVTGISMPVFWLGMLLIIFFAVQLRWFPAGGSMAEYGPKAMVLPAVALGVAHAALIMRMTRASMLEVLGQDYIRTARAKGLREFVVVQRHALSNVLIPIITVVGFQFGYMLGGAVLTETVFSLPGLGRLLIESIARRDYPLVQGCVLFIAVMFVFANLLVDVLYGVFDPRIRYD